MRHAGRPAGRGARRRRRRRTRPRAAVAGPLRRRARSWSARSPPTWPRASVSARAALSAYRAAHRLARRPAPGRERRPAARARPRRRRPRPAPAGRRGLPAAGARPRGTLLETLSALLRPRLVDRGRRPGRCSCTPTPCATGCARSPTSTGLHRPGPRDAFALQLGADPRAPVAVERNFVGTLQRSGRQIRGRRSPRRPATTRHSGRRARHRRPRSRGPDPRLPDALAGGPHLRRPVRLAVRGRRHRPRPLRHRGRRRRRSATPQSPSRCWSRPGCSPPSSSSRTRPTRSARSARSPATASASSTAAAGARVITAEQAMVLVRERGNAMAAAAAATADRHDRRPRRRPRRGARDASSAHGLTAANDNGPGQIVAAGTTEQLAAFAEDPPAKARLMPLSVAGAFHTDHMAPAVDASPRLARSVSTHDPRTPLDLQPRRPGRPRRPRRAPPHRRPDRQPRPLGPVPARR